MHCEVHAEGYMHIQTAGGLVKPAQSLAHSTPAGLSCFGELSHLLGLEFVFSLTYIGNKGNSQADCWAVESVWYLSYRAL